jgi:hypothetical protein
LNLNVAGLIKHSREYLDIADLLRKQGTNEAFAATIRLTFPAKLASRWMPGLFPEITG